MQKIAFYGIVIALLLTGIGLTTYKNIYLGFPLWSGEQTQVWEIEARVRFSAQGEPVKASFAVPSHTPNYGILEEAYVSADYGLSFEEETVRRAIWSIREASGQQSLFYRATIYRTTSDGNGQTPTEGLELVELPGDPAVPYMDEMERTAARAVKEEIRRQSSDPLSFAAVLFTRLREPEPDSNLAALLGTSLRPVNRAEVARNILSLQGIPTRLVRGLTIDRDQRRAEVTFLLEIFDGTDWYIFNPETGKGGLPPDYFVWQRGGVSMLDLMGGENSEVSFSVSRTDLPGDMLARARTATSAEPLLDFSLYTLPLEDQNVFKILLLVPIGALVLVFMRNIIGVATSGTFMPILIALAFQETQVIPGLILFVAVVGVGLVIRSWLSRLNLLLVPRISAVVVIVILLMAALSIVSHKLGLEQGLTVTFFPTIILAWTIERLSILWEEQGQHEALLLGGGSLLVAVLAHLVMDASLIKHLTFAFPELLLCVLALILLIGQYSGYRLLELRRFHSLTQHS